MLQRGRWILFAAAAITACKGTPRSGAGAPASPPRPVTLVEVSRAEGKGAAWVPATVRARRRASLSARITASVVELPFREGERFAAGAVLVRLDDAALRSAVAAAESAAAAAKAESARMESLRARGAATPREAEEASSRAAAAEAALLAARDNLAYAALRAPFAGVVAARPASVGDVVSPGAPLVEIEGDGGFELHATLEADQAGLVRPGFEGRASVDGLPEPLTARLTSVSPAGDLATHRFEVKADLPPAHGLRSGLFARLLLPSSSDTTRLSLPTSALFERGGLTGVFVARDGRAWLRWVAAGAAADGTTEVRSGLEAGEKVVADPEGLADGVAIVEKR
jgi:membrane fusion protein, multidrug efflux system